MKLNNKGFTLVELIIVISIIAILIAMVVPRLNGYTENVRKQVCETNRSELENMYNTYLIIENVQHEEKIFEEYLKEYGKYICPKDGNISYNDGKAECSRHDDINDAEAPYI